MAKRKTKKRRNLPVLSGGGMLDPKHPGRFWGVGWGWWVFLILPAIAYTASYILRGPPPPPAPYNPFPDEGV